ncbi:hypothetical protein IWQ62_000666 [Dispira parvispora]|uniref:Protein rolling stone-like n=1 Tax=Dispira parvispora TaxID=1520584 RepID=A0A9W8AZP7_9FUNG|nr:hypothetical protein IWQ62_000666 [Dispira parvispora]
MATFEDKFHRFFRMETYDAELFVTSNLVQPRTLFFVRCFLMLYCVATTIVLFYTNTYRFFYYMTCWSFLGLTIYLIIATIVSGRYCFGPANMDRRPNLLEGAPRIVQLIYWWLYETITTFHILVPLVYWTLLSSELNTHSSLHLYTSIGPHAIDFAVMATEVLLNRQKVMPTHCVVLLVILAFYLGLAYLVWGATGFFVYSFLDFEKKKGFVALYVLGVAVVFMILYFLQVFIHRGRDYLFRKRRQHVACGEKGNAHLYPLEPGFKH